MPGKFHPDHRSFRPTRTVNARLSFRASSPRYSSPKKQHRLHSTKPRVLAALCAARTRTNVISLDAHRNRLTETTSLQRFVIWITLDEPHGASRGRRINGTVLSLSLPRERETLSSRAHQKGLTTRRVDETSRARHARRGADWRGAWPS